VIIVLNDNGRSYSPTVSRLSLSLTHLRLHRPTSTPASGSSTDPRVTRVGDLALSGVHGLTSALREVVTPTPSSRPWASGTPDPSTATTSPAWSRPWPTPVNGRADRGARAHQKGAGVRAAEEDDIQRLHDFKVSAAPLTSGGPVTPLAGDHLHRCLHRSLLRQAESDSRIVALTAAMAGPTGLLPFEARFLSGSST